MLNPCAIQTSARRKAPQGSPAEVAPAKTQCYRSSGAPAYSPYISQAVQNHNEKLESYTAKDGVTSTELLSYVSGSLERIQISVTTPITTTHEYQRVRVITPYSNRTFSSASSMEVSAVIQNHLTLSGA
jgi:hypothetical protein